MGVQIIKDIKINESLSCFRSCCQENNMTINNDNINNNNFDNNNFDNNNYILTNSSNRIKSLGIKNKYKTKILNKFFDKYYSSKTNFVFNTSLINESEFKIYKITKIQAYIRGLLLKKKLSLLKNQEEEYNDNQQHLAISHSMEGTIFHSDSESSLNNIKNQNSINSNILPFNLKSKNNIKYKYFGYLKDCINKRKIVYNNSLDINTNSNNHIKYIKNGYGKLIFNDNTIFKSTFLENKASGISHYIDEYNNQEFIGEYQNNILNGFGIYTYKKTNHKFTGYFQSNNLNGAAIEENFEEDFTYYGEFVENEKHGYGVIQWKDGTIYEGQFFKNKMNGYAIIKYPEEKIYKGQIKKGKLSGFGAFIWDKQQKFIGHYKNNKRDGFGIFIWDIPKSNNDNSYIIGINEINAYIGFWSEGNIDGVGLKITNKKMQFGFWNNGKKLMRFEKKELIKKYIKKNQIKYMKILLGKKEDIFNLLKSCY